MAITMRDKRGRPSEASPSAIDGLGRPRRQDPNRRYSTRLARHKGGHQVPPANSAIRTMLPGLWWSWGWAWPDYTRPANQNLVGAVVEFFFRPRTSHQRRQAWWRLTTCAVLAACGATASAWICGAANWLFQTRRCNPARREAKEEPYPLKKGRCDQGDSVFQERGRQDLARCRGQFGPDQGAFCTVVVRATPPSAASAW